MYSVASPSKPLYFGSLDTQVSAFCSHVPRPHPLQCILLFVGHFLSFQNNNNNKKPGGLVIFKWLVGPETCKQLCVALRCWFRLLLWLQNLLSWDLLNWLSWDRGWGYILLHDDLWVQRQHRPVSCLYCELSWYWGINVGCDPWNGAADPGNWIEQWTNICTYILKVLRASCLTLEINAFGCYEAKIEESEKATASLSLFSPRNIQMHYTWSVHVLSHISPFMWV